MDSAKQSTVLVRGALALALVLAGGCFFETRDPETGGGPVCFEKLTQDNQINVFLNLDGSFACRQSQSYLDQFAEDFEFIPSSSASAQNPAVNDWDIEDERAFANALFSSSTDTIIANVYTQLEPPTNVGSGEEYKGSYSIRVVTNGSEIEYTGTAFYTLVQERAIWLIQTWREEESSNPFGLLRASLAQ